MFAKVEYLRSFNKQSLEKKLKETAGKLYENKLLQGD